MSSLPAPLPLPRVDTKLPLLSVHVHRHCHHGTGTCTSYHCPYVSSSHRQCCLHILIVITIAHASTASSCCYQVAIVHAGGWAGMGGLAMQLPVDVSLCRAVVFQHPLFFSISSFPIYSPPLSPGPSLGMDTENDSMALIHNKVGRVTCCQGQAQNRCQVSGYSSSRTLPTQKRKWASFQAMSQSPRMDVLS